MMLTPRCKRVIDLAYGEAKRLRHDYIGTEHLLLGLIRECDGLGGRVLTKLGVELEATRSEVKKLKPAGTGPDFAEVLKNRLKGWLQYFQRKKS